MVVLIDDAENVELKFLQLRRNLNPSCTKPFGTQTLY